MLGDAGEASIFFNHTLDAARGKAAEIAVLTRGAGIFGIVEEKGGEGIMTDTEVIFDPGGGGFVDENRAVFTAFAADNELAAV